MKCCCLLGVLFFTTAAFSQGAEKIYSIANPYGSAMRIESLSVDDTADFAIESLKPLPLLLVNPVRLISKSVSFLVMALRAPRKSAPALRRFIR